MQCDISAHRYTWHMGKSSTTIRLPADLFKAVKYYAAENNTTFTAVVEAALEEKLASARKPFELVTFHGKLRPGVNLNNNAEVLELMEEGLDITSRR